MLFRRLFLERLKRAFAAGALRFVGDLAHLPDPAAFPAHVAAMRRIDWVVYAKKPFGGPAQVLGYLGRYTHRVAIANSRIKALDADCVAFTWKNYRNNGAVKVMRLKPDEFIRRFLLHALPDGFHRMRTSDSWPTPTAPPGSLSAARFWPANLSRRRTAKKNRRQWIRTSASILQPTQNVAASSGPSHAFPVAAGGPQTARRHSDATRHEARNGEGEDQCASPQPRRPDQRRRTKRRAAKHSASRSATRTASDRTPTKMFRAFNRTKAHAHFQQASARPCRRTPPCPRSTPIAPDAPTFPRLRSIRLQ